MHECHRALQPCAAADPCACRLPALNAYTQHRLNAAMSTPRCFPRAAPLQGLRGSIPPNFPYMHVEFGIADGFVHVIDDEANFDRGLARSVMIGGWLGVMPALPRSAQLVVRPHRFTVRISAPSSICGVLSCAAWRAGPSARRGAGAVRAHWHVGTRAIKAVSLPSSGSNLACAPVCAAQACWACRRRTCTGGQGQRTQPSSSSGPTNSASSLRPMVRCCDARTGRG